MSLNILKQLNEFQLLLICTTSASRMIVSSICITHPTYKMPPVALRHMPILKGKRITCKQTGNIQQLSAACLFINFQIVVP